MTITGMAMMDAIITGRIDHASGVRRVIRTAWATRLNAGPRLAKFLPIASVGERALYPD